MHLEGSGVGQYDIPSIIHDKKSGLIFVPYLSMLIDQNGTTIRRCYSKERRITSSLHNESLYSCVTIIQNLSIFMDCSHFLWTQAPVHISNLSVPLSDIGLLFLPQESPCIIFQNRNYFTQYGNSFPSNRVSQYR